MSNHIVGLSRPTRKEAQELWNVMYDTYDFKHLPRELVSRYDDIFRSILSEIVSNLIQHDLGHYRSYIMNLDYASWIYWLQDSNPASYTEIYNAFKLGNGLCESIIDELDDEHEDVNAIPEDELEDAVDYAVANTVMLVMPTTNEFNRFEKAVWQDIQDSNLIDTYFHGDLLVSIRPGLTRALITDNCTLAVT